MCCFILILSASRQEHLCLHVLFTAEGSRELISYAGSAFVRMRSSSVQRSRSAKTVFMAWVTAGGAAVTALLSANTGFIHSASLWTGLSKSCLSVKTDRWRPAWTLCARLCNFTSLHGKLIFSLNPWNRKRRQGKQFETVLI